tara:strand:+ start:7534 stop:7704 length:171 start_codon:yes stop_codon:yes gene_type:complete
MDSTIEDLLEYTSTNPLLRKLMSSEEIKVVNKLVKEGKMFKGISDDKQKSITYYAK